MLFDEQVKRRLKRVEGQVKGIIKMMEDEKSCKEVSMQLSAVRGAVDTVLAYVVAANLEQCILQEKEEGIRPGDVVKEAVELLVKSK